MISATFFTEALIPVSLTSANVRSSVVTIAPSTAIVAFLPTDTLFSLMLLCRSTEMMSSSFSSTFVIVSLKPSFSTSEMLSAVMFVTAVVPLVTLTFFAISAAVTVLNSAPSSVNVSSCLAVEPVAY